MKTAIEKGRPLRQNVRTFQTRLPVAPRESFRPSVDSSREPSPTMIS